MIQYLEKILSVTIKVMKGVSLRCWNTNEQKEARSQSVISKDKSTQIYDYSC